MQIRWTHFVDEQIQLRLKAKAQEMGAAFSVDSGGRVLFNDEEWCLRGDPQIVMLDDVFGPEWVTVNANNPQQRSERIEWLQHRGVQFVVWLDSFNGVSVVLNRRDCPADWDYA